jgi:CHAT domain-containing protein
MTPAGRVVCGGVIVILGVIAACAVTVAAPPAPAQPPAGPAVVDQALVGTWRMAVGGRGGMSIVSLTIAADGRYQMAAQGAGKQPSESGQFTAHNGRWALKADAGRADHGTLGMPAPGALRLTSFMNQVESGHEVMWLRAFSADGKPGAAPPPAVAPPAKPPVVEPALCGVWRSVSIDRTAFVISTRTIDADGHYRTATQGPGNPPDEVGQVTFANGRWTLRSDAGRTNQGTYQWRDNDAVLIASHFGPAIWFRFAGGDPDEKQQLTEAFGKLTADRRFAWLDSIQSDSAPDALLMAGKVDGAGLEWVQVDEDQFVKVTAGRHAGLCDVKRQGHGWWAEGGNSPGPAGDLRDAMGARSATPSELYDQLRGGIRNVRRTDFGFAADVGPVMTMRALHLDRPPGGAASGTLRVWVTDGVTTRVEFGLTPARPPKEGDDLDLTTKRVLVISSVGTASIDVPDDVLASLGATQTVTVHPLTSAEHPTGQVEADYADLYGQRNERAADEAGGEQARVRQAERMCDEARTAMGEGSLGYIAALVWLADAQSRGGAGQSAAAIERLRGVLNDYAAAHAEDRKPCYVLRRKLSLLCAAAGKIDEARDLLKRSVDLDKTSTDPAIRARYWSDLANLAAFDTSNGPVAEGMRLGYASAGHPTVQDDAADVPFESPIPDVMRGRASASDVLGLMRQTADAANRGDFDGACAFAVQGVRGQLANDAMLAPYMPPHEGLVPSQITNDSMTSVGVAVLVRQSGKDAAARRVLADAILALKGRGEELDAGRHAVVAEADDPSLRSLYEFWRRMADRTSLAAKLGPVGPESPAEYAKRVEHLASRRDNAADDYAKRALASGQLRGATPTGLGDVAASLKAGSALVEFMRYRTFDFTAKTPQDPTYGYLAMVLKGGQAGPNPEVTIVPLPGTVKEVDDQVHAWLRLLTSRSGAPDHPQQVSAAGRAVADRLWKPIAAALGDCRKVYVSPDGDLSFVPFAALPQPNTDRFLIEDVDLAYVSSGRSLIGARLLPGGAPLVVGGPDYGPPAMRHPATRPSLSELSLLLGHSFLPLPGTRREAADVAQVLGVPAAAVLADARATKAAILAVQHPAILHLATHGFFLSAPSDGSGRGLELDPQEDQPARAPATQPTNAPGQGGRPPSAPKVPSSTNDPMDRSGLVLAGANDTLAGRKPFGPDDGILTANEASAMDLLGTRLVVLSACDSGLGQSQNWDGVYGLRRALAVAGARHIVMSLWCVQDQTTAELMKSFYQHLAPPPHGDAGQAPSPESALLAAQRGYIDAARRGGQWPDPYLWAPFVASGSGASLEPGAP